MPLARRARSSSDDMTSPTTQPDTNQGEKFVHPKQRLNYFLNVLLINSVHRTGLEEFACIDTTSDPLHYSTCNSEFYLIPLVRRTVMRKF